MCTSHSGPRVLKLGRLCNALKPKLKALNYGTGMTKLKKAHNDLVL